MEPVECVECTLLETLTGAINDNHTALVLQLTEQNTALQTSLTTLYTLNFAMIILISLFTLNTILHHFFEKRGSYGKDNS